MGVFRNKSRKSILLMVLSALLVMGLLFWMFTLFVHPAPAKVLYISTGSESGAYHNYAKQYQAILARDGIQLELLPSTGALENLRRLKDPGNPSSVAFVQGGVGSSDDTNSLVSLGSMYYEPLWVFYRDAQSLDRVSQLQGKRLAIGAEGSGTRRLVLQILAVNNIGKSSENLLPLSGDEAVDALMRNEVDAIFIIAGADSPAVRNLLVRDGIQLMNFVQADGYVKRFPFLSKVVLPRGTVDFERDIPGQDVTLVAATANLIARSDIHPALITLLTQAAVEVHGKQGMFQQANEFPAFKDRTFNISKTADRYYKSGPPFLQQYLPFWLATFIDSILVLVIPLLALIPILKAIPSIYSWHITSRIYRWYSELSTLEHEIKSHYDPARYDDYMAKIDSIEERANHKPIPAQFDHLRYTLREHINLARASLEKQSGKKNPVNP